MTSPNGSFQPLLDALPCGAALIDRAGRIVHANLRVCEMMGRGKADVVGVELTSLYSNDAEASEQIREVLRHFDQAREGEFYLPRPDGTRLPVLTTARRLDPPDGELRLVTMADLSQQKQKEDDLRA